MKMKIKYLSDLAQKPEFKTNGSAGMDLTAAIEAPMELKVGARILVPTGMAMQIPMGYGGFIFPRSGLAHKKGISMSNGVGVIDGDYTGEIKVALCNISDADYVINPGDRIAQMVIMPVAAIEFIEADELDETERGDGGFGSTGR